MIGCLNLKSVSPLFGTDDREVHPGVAEGILEAAFACIVDHLISDVARTDSGYCLLPELTDGHPELSCMWPQHQIGLLSFKTKSYFVLQKQNYSLCALAPLT